MPITINGSSGIVGANGSVTFPALTGADIDTGVFFPEANVVAFSTGSVESFRANANGIFATANVNVTNLTATNLTATNVIPTSSFLRNRIINGDMRIDQRNAGVEVNPAVTATYYLDRWQATSTAASKFKIGQNAGAVTPPTGYTNYLGLTSLSAYTVGAAESFGVRQLIEGLNVSDLAWGTASAATVTISFWVRSSLTGTFGGSLRNSDGTRSYPFTYTVSVANTWEQKTVTIAGDTSGTWLTTNGIGIILIFSIGAGSTFSGTAGAWAAANYLSATGAVSVVGTASATFYITGVQLEVGTVATPFERQIYSNQLAMCQRYYYEQNITIQNPSVGSALQQYNFLVTMRAIPTITNKTVGTLSNISVLNNAGDITTQGFFFQVSISGANGYITGRVNTVSAEL